MSHPGPKYRALAKEIRRLIRSGAWPAGSQIPTELELARRFQVSRGTVRQALQILTQEGLLSREQGRGTFVRAPSPGVALSLTSFAEAMRRQGKVPQTRLLAREVLPAEPLLARRLHLPPGTELLRIERLRLADGQPVCHEIRWLARDLCPDLLHEDLEQRSIHHLLIHAYHIPLTRMTHTVGIIGATEELAGLLQVPEGTPLFAVERLTYTTGDRPAVYYQARFRSDEYQFVFEVHVESEGVRGRE